MNSTLFFRLWRLVQILELCSYDIRVLVSVPSNLQSLSNLADAFFKGLFCQKAFS